MCIPKRNINPMLSKKIVKINIKYSFVKLYTVNSQKYKNHVVK